MAFELQDFHDLVEILERHPEWRAELRRLVLTDELVTLPETTRDLVAAQRRTEQHLQQLAEAQRKTQQQLSQLAEDLEGLKTIVQGLV